MLQATKPFALETNAPPESSPRAMVHWAIGIARRQIVLIVSIALLIALLGALYAFLAPPTYTAEASVLIDPRRVQLFKGATFTEGDMDAPALESQVELVKSEPVALAVVKKFGLEHDAEFLVRILPPRRSAICITISCPKRAQQGPFQLRGY